MSGQREGLDAQLVLAAVDRAGRHRGGEGYVPMRWIAAHLGLPHNGWTTRRVRPFLDALTQAGAVVSERRHGHPAWVVTDTGRQRLGRAGLVLPESPQHEQWRRARELAHERVEGCREGLRGALGDAHRLLDAEGIGVDPGRVRGEMWVDLGERLAWECERLGVALFCLNEWAEPEDANRDSPSFPNAHRIHTLEPESWAATKKGDAA